MEDITPKLLVWLDPHGVAFLTRPFRNTRDLEVVCPTQNFHVGLNQIMSWGTPHLRDRVMHISRDILISSQDITEMGASFTVHKPIWLFGSYLKMTPLARFLVEMLGNNVVLGRSELHISLIGLRVLETMRDAE